MQIESFIGATAAKDPTWAQAQSLVTKRLQLSGNLLQLIRGSWSGSLQLSEFVKLLGFSGMGSGCLLRAAEIATAPSNLSKQDLEEILRGLGLNFSGIILAVNAVVRSLLQSQPPPGWRSLLQEMMNDMEVGYRLGQRAEALGRSGGVLTGFARGAGLSILMSGDPARYREWQNQQRQSDRPVGELAREIFGCEPYQVSAFVLQQIGFGTEAAVGLACALGDLNSRYLQLSESQQLWPAAYAWLAALRAGRNYPAQVAYRGFFKELNPPPRGIKNLSLEVLYTEIAKIRTNGSGWTWHLPKPTYDEVKEAYQL